jgi:hypothetical protein
MIYSSIFSPLLLSEVGVYKTYATTGKPFFERSGEELTF